MGNSRFEVREGLSQLSYQETPYEDSSYEIIGVFEGGQEFEPLEFAVVGSSEATIDPMFGDFGRTPQAELPRRWHLPEQLAKVEYQKHAEADHVPEGTLLTDQQIEQIRAEALAQGQQLGLESAIEQSNARIQQMEQRIATLRSDIDNQVRERLHQIEREAATLALEVARKVITFAVDINPEYIYQIIHEVIALSGSAKITQIRVSPEDMEFLTVVGMSRDLKEKKGDWHFVADPSIRTGCVLESSAGEIDMRLDSAWERVRDEVVKVIK